MEDTSGQSGTVEELCGDKLEDGDKGAQLDAEVDEVTRAVEDPEAVDDVMRAVEDPEAVDDVTRAVEESEEDPDNVDGATKEVGKENFSSSDSVAKVVDDSASLDPFVGTPSSLNSSKCTFDRVQDSGAA